MATGVVGVSEVDAFVGEECVSALAHICGDNIRVPVTPKVDDQTGHVYTNLYKQYVLKTACSVYKWMLDHGKITSDDLVITMTKFRADPAYMCTEVAKLTDALVPDMLQHVKVVDGAYTFDASSSTKNYAIFANNHVGGDVVSPKADEWGFGNLQEESLAWMFAHMAALVAKQRIQKSPLEYIDPAGAPYNKGCCAIGYSLLTKLVDMDSDGYGSGMDLLVSGRLTIDEIEACFASATEEEILAKWCALWVAHPLSDAAIQKYVTITRSRKTPGELEALKTKPIFSPVFERVSGKFYAINANKYAPPKFVAAVMPPEIVGDAEKVAAFKAQVVTLKAEYDARCKQDVRAAQCKPDNLLALLTKVYAGFSSGVGENHSGKLGCGFFGNEPGIVAAVQVIAWYMVNRDRGTADELYFHAMGDKPQGQFPESYHIAENIAMVIRAMQTFV